MRKKAITFVHILRLENVSRAFEQGRINAINQVSLFVEQGSFIALLGSSGSGKSTLLNLMTGLDSPTRGQVFYRDVEPVRQSQWCRIRKHHIGFVFQSFNLIPTLTAVENVQIPMFGTGLSAVKRRQRAQTLLDLVGLSQRFDHMPSKLSGGELQRVAVARSLANEPDIIVADEPTGNLDSGNSKQVIDLLESIHKDKGTTLLLVTHDMEIASRAEHLIRLADGSLVTGSQPEAAHAL